uniref:Uncharacterized protein n=1 Tax=Anguilla anguilla TaxID=7936 RepID=A0A0E9PEY6_ANGAN
MNKAIVKYHHCAVFNKNPGHWIL